MALQPRVRNHRWQSHEEQSFYRKIGDLGVRWRKQR
jgi:hypothetical protein